jgi:hypothetical protein
VALQSDESVARQLALRRDSPMKLGAISPIPTEGL